MDAQKGFLWLIGVVWIVGISGAAWAAELKIEAGEKKEPLTVGQTQTITQAINDLGGVREKLDVKQGRIEASVKNDALTAGQIRNLVTRLREAGVPFELKLKGAGLSPADVAALRSQFAGMPVEFKERADKGIQVIKIEIEHPEAKDHHGGGAQEIEHRRGEHEKRAEFERAERRESEVERPERPETEKPEVERPEIEKPEVERPERPETEKPEVERPETERVEKRD